MCKWRKLKAPPHQPSVLLSHRLTAHSLHTSVLHNECMCLRVWGNKIATCFVFSRPDLTVVSAALRLFISSCAVAIYPAASADNSTISHQQQWVVRGGGGGVGVTGCCCLFLHSPTCLILSLKMNSYETYIHCLFHIRISEKILFHRQFISFDKGIHLVWDQTF